MLLPSQMGTRLSGRNVPSVERNVMAPSPRQNHSHVYSEQGGSRFVWNVGKLPPNYVTSEYRRRLYELLSELEFFFNICNLEV